MIAPLSSVEQSPDGTAEARPVNTRRAVAHSYRHRRAAGVLTGALVVQLGDDLGVGVEQLGLATAMVVAPLVSAIAVAVAGSPGRSR